MDDNPEPDPFEKRLRFGCGFVFGGLAAFFVLLQQVADMTGGFWSAVLGVAVVFGVLAVRYGDEFWHRVSDWFRWW